eukprot:scaffold1237_cov243-Pinguiococcus_pyrenoidosus.AAC.30
MAARPMTAATGPSTHQSRRRRSAPRPHRDGRHRNGPAGLRCYRKGDVHQLITGMARSNFQIVLANRRRASVRSPIPPESFVGSCSVAPHATLRASAWSLPVCMSGFDLSRRTSAQAPLRQNLPPATYYADLKIMRPAESQWHPPRACTLAHVIGFQGLSADSFSAACLPPITPAAKERVGDLLQSKLPDDDSWPFATPIAFPSVISATHAEARRSSWRHSAAE